MSTQFDIRISKNTFYITLAAHPDYNKRKYTIQGRFVLFFLHLGLDYSSFSKHT